MLRIIRRDKLVQRYNLAIGDVSKARRNTNR